MQFRGREHERARPAHMASMSTPQLPRDFLLYRPLGTVEEECTYGDKHKVTYVEALYVSPNGETREHDNGYQKQQTALAADRRGRIYHQHVAIDFFNNISWIRDADRARFTPRPPTGAVRDVRGKSVQKCPDGQAWSELQNPGLDDTAAAEKALRDLGVDPTPERVAEILAMKTEDQS